MANAVKRIMLTKKQTLYCLKKMGRTTKEKNALLREVENSKKEFFTDEEVQEFQMRLSRIRDQYDRIYYDNSCYFTEETIYFDYNGCNESIWD